MTDQAHDLLTRDHEGLGSTFPPYHGAHKQQSEPIHWRLELYARVFYKALNFQYNKSMEKK